MKRKKKRKRTAACLAAAAIALQMAGCKDASPAVQSVREVKEQDEKQKEGEYITQEFEFYSDDEHLICYNFPETYELEEKTYKREGDAQYETLGVKEGVQAVVEMNVEELSEVPDVYVYESESGRTYELRSDQIYIKEQGQVDIPVVEEVFYENQAGRPSVPSKKTITYYDKEAKEDREVTGFLKELAETRAGRWMDVLQIDGVFMAPSAACSEYELAGAPNVHVSRSADAPTWEGYEGDVLNSLGLPSEFYRITGAAWNGTDYWSDEGGFCRKALFTGDMFVADYKAVYEGAHKADGYSTRVYYRADAAKVNALEEDIITLYRIKAVVKYQLVE